MMKNIHFNAFFKLMRADKPIGSYLLLWPTLIALWFASEGLPDLKILAVFVAGVFVMRSAGCVINDIADRKVDGHIERTKHRPLVSGEVTTRQALGLFGFLVLIALGLVLLLDWKTILLSIGALVLATCYPFMKRFTYLPQFVLGAAFSWAIPMAFMAIQGEVPLWSWWLYLANLLWTVAYDTQYAMVDREDDLLVGVKSTAILFGQYDRAIIGLLQFVVLAIMGAIGFKLQFNTAYYLLLFVVAALFIYQQYLIRGREREPCFKAFLNNNYVGLVLAFAVVNQYANYF
ncbi:4-hydroxybenzoate octaprenyltransferase [Alteromonadaceae bacterium M269]|nr:4-hydroxybenzoate octaprenyltransferase [Alteromonadaceae bacterium M269]